MDHDRTSEAQPELMMMVHDETIPMANDGLALAIIMAGKYPSLFWLVEYYFFAGV